ncbi:MAG: VWA domain-containing protein [Treponema sp.]|nr:VWA domain-containing protein [Treponema sp.]
MRKFVLIFLCSIMAFSVFAQTEEQKPVYTAEQQRLRVTAEDIRLVPETDLPTKGYHLYVRKRPEIESIMLTETTKDPEGKNDSFAYRAREYNKYNGDEIRFLNGLPLVSEWAKYSLVDSTPEDFKAFGKAFHIYIPEVLDYGYEWERHGSVTIGKGTFINIRTFEKKYADYTGAFMDSPFMFDLREHPKKVVKAPVEETPVAETVLTDDYNPIANDKFSEIAENLVLSKGPESLTDDILKCLENLDPKTPCDLVFAIDATGSMKNDLETLKSELVPGLLEKFRDFEDIRFGLLFYRDYTDSFRYRELPVKLFEMTPSLTDFNKNLASIVIKGKEGGDIPEAVYEALYASVAFTNLRPGAYKKVILIGDAEPHPTPRGTRKYSREYVTKQILAADAHVDAILLPEGEK